MRFCFEKNNRNSMANFWQLFCLFWLFAGGLCCNSDWFRHKGKCYRASHTVYSVEMAKRFCQVLGAELAVIDSADLKRALNTMSNFNGIHEYWINEDSSALETTTYHSSTDNYHDLCPYLKVLKIDFEFCTEKKFFLCESSIPDMGNICPTGFVYFGSHCFLPISSAPSNYEDATNLCIMHNGQLAMLETEEKEWDAKSALLGRNQTFLVAARKFDGIVKWKNQVLFSPIHGFFANYSEGDCVGFLSDKEHPLVFSWAHVKCDEKNSFLCEAEPNAAAKSAVSTVPSRASTGTTLAPLECPHGLNWKMHVVSGYCFWETTYETERLNWYQARDFCKLYGGDLASYNSVDQESTGIGGAHGHYRGLWIGLKRDENNVFHWADGNTLNYTNWDFTEPKLNSKSKFCVTHSAGSSKWALDYCGVRRWFICRAPKVRKPPVPDIPTREKTRCDIQGYSVYSSQWYLFDGHCYLIHDSGKYTWDTAQHFCQDNDAHLVSIHSFEETDFIMTVVSSYPDSDFWIGLSAHGLHGSFEWTDNTALDFIYWADNKSEPKDFNTCVNFNKREGSWDIDNCNRLQGVICKRGINSSYDFASTEATTIMPGNCGDGWYNLGNKCFKYFGSLWSQRLTWGSAKMECDSLGASLVSVHNQDEQDFLTDIVLEASSDLWIGLRSIESGTIFHWSDDTRMDYTNWKVNEPDFRSEAIGYLQPTRELCVEMEYGENIMGKWNDIGCEEKRAYICQKMKDPTNKGPYHDPFNCPNMTAWYRLGTSCYGFFEQRNSTWLQAQAECKKHGANLITYRNMAVSIFVKRKLKRRDVHYWIGIREKMRDKYEYVTGHPLFYTNWMVGQPQAASSVLDNCVVTTADGEWMVKSCKDPHPFMCKLNRDPEPEPEIDRTHVCKNLTGEWNDFGGDYCYLYATDLKVSWIDAMHYCFRHGGYLASFHSIEEVNRATKAMGYYGKPLTIHIGLGKKKDGSYSWVDNSPFDFINWDEDEPSSGHNDKQCAEMNTRTGQWSTVDCDDSYRGFVCSSPKMKLSMYFEDALSSNTTSEAEIISTKLAVGGIFGIIICISVILAIAGVAVYYLRPTKPVQPRLLETDNL